MNFALLQEKKEYYVANRHLIPATVIANYNSAFEIEYTHNSTAIEGNTLSLIETKVILEDKVSIGGKDLREIFEVVNHNNAYNYIKKCITNGKPLDEIIIKEIHSILMEKILIGGIYRNVEVYISGAQHMPPAPQDMYHQIKNFYLDLAAKKDTNPIEFAAWTHAEFVKIHPFIDGNGRTSRLIMNYQLMANGYFPVSISKDDRLKYFECLETYAIDSNLTQFTELIADLELQQLDKYIKAIEASK